MKVRTELPFLEALVLFNKCKVCVEVGVAKGQAAVYICNATKQIDGEYYGFDDWDWNGLKKQFKPLGSIKDVSRKLDNIGFSKYKLIKIDTIEEKERFKQELDNLCPNGIDFAFIDGAHSYLGIKNDFSVVYPRLTEHGIIVFHDTRTIDGCREFMLDLRTKFYDGTFDIVDMPFGNGITRSPGLAVLMKRVYPLSSFCIDEICGSISTPREIELREVEWYESEVKKNLKSMQILEEQDNIKTLDKLGRYLGRKKFE